MKYPANFTEKEVEQVYKLTDRVKRNLKSGGNRVFDAYENIVKLQMIMQRKLDNNEVNSPVLKLNEDKYYEWKNLLSRVKSKIKSNQQVVAYNMIDEFTNEFTTVRDDIVLDNEKVAL